MPSASTILAFAWLVIASQHAEATARGHRAISCPLPSGETLAFSKPAKLGDLPKIELDNPSKVTLFSFRDGNFLVVAMDEAEPSRLRLVISAQFDKTTGAYAGQLVIDAGGNQLQLENRPVSCRVGP